ncbi:MAG: hypothetical protein K6A70_02700 [Erysipelotrichaceae bacterium]|nr:hypothetical protein [Erysipelotrichaceae bacterium]
MKAKLKITNPAAENALIEYRRDFEVEGQISGIDRLDDECELIVSLYDEKGQLLRRVRNTKAGSQKQWLKHPDLISYKEELDPDKEKLKEYGFAELIVKDLDDPEASFHDATIKVFLSDGVFRAIIVSASDVSHGRIFESGVDYTDEEGKPYDCLPTGKYELEVELKYKDEIWGQTAKSMKIGVREKSAIVRFNPLKHKERMLKWCKENDFSIVNDTLPGYLNPYLGKWYYHMGLLPYYRSNDIALYQNACVHMFIYLCDETSTSYESELAYLEAQGKVKDEKTFVAYHYDIGEAYLGKSKSYYREAVIKKFDDSNLQLYRLDIVNDKAEENVFDLSEEAIDDIIYDLNNIKIKAGKTFALSGVVKPWQFAQQDYILKKDNTYEIRNTIDEIVYSFECEGKVKTENRKLNMLRIDKEPIGRSVFEFYNLFKIDESYKDKHLKIIIKAIDRYGCSENAQKEIELDVV